MISAMPEPGTKSSNEWLTEGLGAEEGFCLTVIQNVTPTEALRRFGAPADAVFTTTWPELVNRSAATLAQEAAALGKYAYQIVWGHCAAIAFAVGGHALLVEDNGSEGVDSHAWSRGTRTVSTYESINADVDFVISENGEILARMSENAPSSAFGADTSVLTDPLAAMGITDPAAFDRDESNYHALDVIELFCRAGGIRPTVDDMRRPALGAVFRKDKL